MSSCQAINNDAHGFEAPGFCHHARQIELVIPTDFSSGPHCELDITAGGFNLCTTHHTLTLMRILLLPQTSDLQAHVPVD